MTADKHTSTPAANDDFAGAAMVRFNFHGDTIDVVPEAGRAWVVVRRVCEVLGVDESSQRVKLKTKSWATAAFITAVAEDGKIREQFCIDLESLPMWLATIEPARVAERIRPKLVDYQRDAARVLADHFLGKRVADLPKLLEQQAERQAAAFKDVLAARDRDADRLRAENYELRTNQDNGIIQHAQVDWLKSESILISHMWAALGKCPKVKQTPRAALTAIHNKITDVAGWHGKGKTLDGMPSVKFPFVKAWILSEKEDCVRAMKRANKSASDLRAAAYGRGQTMFHLFTPAGATAKSTGTDPVN